MTNNNHFINRPKKGNHYQVEFVLVFSEATPSIQPLNIEIPTTQTTITNWQCDASFFRDKSNCN